jgi:uncharacterized OB-fold protein
MKATQSNAPKGDDYLLDYPDFDRAFLQYIAKGELRLPYCTKCDSGFGLGQRVCSKDLSTDVIWRPASGNAMLYSFAIYRRPYSPDAVVPYSVAWVELEEGPLLISVVATSPDEELVIGMALRAEFAPAGRLTFRGVCHG